MRFVGCGLVAIVNSSGIHIVVDAVAAVAVADVAASGQ